MPIPAAKMVITYGSGTTGANDGRLVKNTWFAEIENLPS
jgi:hypothetical protein